MPERTVRTASEPGHLTVTVGDSDAIELDVDADETVCFEWAPSPGDRDE